MSGLAFRPRADTQRNTRTLPQSRAAGPMLRRRPAADRRRTPARRARPGGTPRPWRPNTRILPCHRA